MNRMNRYSWIAPVVLMTAIGCGSNAVAPSSPSGSSQAAPPGDVSQVGAGEDEDESTTDLAEHHRHHHHGGFAMFIAMSLDTLGTTPEQQPAIARIQADMHAAMRPAHDAEKTVLLLLADGIAAGNIDQAKVDAAAAQVSAAAAGVHAAVAASLDQLHATLTPSQRAALVDKVEAHFDVWHHANTVNSAANTDLGGSHLGQLAKQLELTPDQVEKIRASFNVAMSTVPPFDRSEAEQHMNAFATAFASDTFDAKTLTAGSAVNAHIAAWGVSRMARMYEAASPVLTPAQRTKLADELRRHANYKRTESDT